MAIHVLPIDDLKPHVESGEWCHCKPRIERHADTLVIHNAYDGREFEEAVRTDDEKSGFYHLPDGRGDN